MVVAVMTPSARLMDHLGTMWVQTRHELLGASPVVLDEMLKVGDGLGAAKRTGEGNALQYNMLMHFA